MLTDFLSQEPRHADPVQTAKNSAAHCRRIILRGEKQQDKDKTSSFSETGTTTTHPAVCYSIMQGLPAAPMPNAVQEVRPRTCMWDELVDWFSLIGSTIRLLRKCPLQRRQLP
jgi:hypothetical protein